MLFAKKQLAAQVASRGQPVLTIASEAPGLTDPDHPSNGESPKRDGLPNVVPSGASIASNTSSDLPRAPQSVGPPHASNESTPPFPPRQAGEYIEELFQILKTAFPLLLLSMETVVDQLTQRFKANPEEEIYRLVSMLMGDGIQVGNPQQLT